jgi:hypothetical protein
MLVFRARDKDLRAAPVGMWGNETGKAEKTNKGVLKDRLPRWVAFTHSC